MVTFISYIVALVAFVFLFLKMGVGKEDFDLKDQIQDLYLREMTSKKSLVQLRLFRENPRGKDIKFYKNEDVFLLFYKKFPILRITQVASIFIGFVTLVFGFTLLTNKQIRSYGSAELFTKGITHIGLDVVFLFGAITILIINSIWLFFFRGRLISLLKRLSKLNPEKEIKSS